MESCTTDTPAKSATELDPQAIDTCDACGPSAQASFWAEMKDGAELSYCGHHGAKYKPKIIRIATTVHDLTYIAMSR